MKKQAVILFLIAIIVSNFCFAQNYSQLAKSDTITIHSKIFETERKIIVTKSLKIKDEARDNNCIVYMDADDKTINGIFLQSANNLIAFNEIPQSYLVGMPGYRYFLRNAVRFVKHRNDFFCKEFI